MKFTPQRVTFLHSIDGVNYSLDVFLKSRPRNCHEVATSHSTSRNCLALWTVFTFIGVNSALHKRREICNITGAKPLFLSPLQVSDATMIYGMASVFVLKETLGIKESCGSVGQSHYIIAFTAIKIDKWLRKSASGSTISPQRYIALLLIEAREV